MRGALALFLVVAACAAPPPPKPQTPSLRPAFDTLAIGKSTKADVRAALGEATVIDFDSGYEVWVYRERPGGKPPPPVKEYVLLFSPSGVLTKSRVR
jgi:hypothetical protein